MCEKNEIKLAKGFINFKQGNESLVKENDDIEAALGKIKDKISDLVNVKNLHFLLGAGASSDAIPAMAKLLETAQEKIEGAEIYDVLVGFNHEELKVFYNKIKNNSDNNLEKLLGTLYSKRAYQEGIDEKDDINDYVINIIENHIYNSINIDLSSAHAEKSLSIYNKFYQKLSLRNKDLARVNVFTTNNDLISETSLSYLNINYNNGFSSGVSRSFNPARFSYTNSRKIDSSIEKYEPLENMVYLYKLHGSISWIESDDNSLFNIKEIDIKPGTPSCGENVIVYPTPLKQNKSLGAPYADLIREFQSKLLLKHGVLIVIGYGFNDEHINNAIYSALASNSSLSIVIFGNYTHVNLTKIPDRRIYQISGSIPSEMPCTNIKIHYFDYIANNIIPDLDRNQDDDILKKFVSYISPKGTEKWL